MDNTISFNDAKKKALELSYGMIFLRSEDKMDDFANK